MDGRRASSGTRAARMDGTALRLGRGPIRRTMRCPDRWPPPLPPAASDEGSMEATRASSPSDSDEDEEGDGYSSMQHLQRGQHFGQPQL
eukprot:5845288-Alexandrium_andersonii.AAC.1